jgi:signal transduction histidine kinase
LDGEIIDFKYLLVNNAAEKILGRAKEDLIGKRWLEEFPRFRNLGLFEIQKRVIETGKSEYIEFFDDAENVNRWFRNGYIKFKDGLLVTRDDITDLKEANIKLEKTQLFLLDSQAIAQVGSFEWDIVNDRITGTPEYLRLFSYEEKLHSVNEFFERVHPHDKENVKQAIANALTNKSPFDIKYAIIRPNGSMRFFWGRAHVYFDKAGKPTRMIGAVSNISKLKEIETELKKAKDDLQVININLEERVKNRTRELSVVIEQLKSTNNRLDKFAYVISHALKAPVNSIEGLINIIQDEYKVKPFDQEAEEILSMMHTTIYNMKHLIDDVLKSAKNEKSIKEPVDLYSLTQKIVHILNPPPHFHIFIQHTLPTVKYNKTALMQILQNLISNAIKYMDKENPLIKIESVENNRHYQICISDNGPGIAKEMQNKIFEIFEIAHNDTTKDSHGVGLSIVKQLVEQHQGRIWVESAIGKETSFCFTIPK